MNVIAMFKEGRGICYYVNIATPTIEEGGYLKYIDYDLDVKVYPDGVERTLDEHEYERHILTYGYHKDLSHAIEKSMEEVKQMIANKEFPFDPATIERIHDRFYEENRPMEAKPKDKGRFHD